MKNETTRLSQLRELHQRIVDQPGCSPSTRWELWGRIHHADQMLAKAATRSPLTPHRTLAVEKRSMFGRLSLMAAVITCGLALAAQLTSLAGSKVRSSTWTPLVGTALVAGVSAADLGMRADEYQRVVQLFDSAHSLEPRLRDRIDEDEDVDLDADTEWVWVCECDDAGAVAPPIFSAAYNVPLLAVV